MHFTYTRDKSVINYFSIKVEFIAKDIEDFRRKTKWKYLPRFALNSNSFLGSLFMKSVNSNFYFPGTHCSFLAVKK